MGDGRWLQCGMGRAIGNRDARRALNGRGTELSRSVSPANCASAEVTARVERRQQVRSDIGSASRAASCQDGERFDDRRLEPDDLRGVLVEVHGTCASWIGEHGACRSLCSSVRVG
jgi:hypothetical protein